MGAFDSHLHFQPGSSGEFWKAFFSKDSFHGTDRELRTFIGEAFNDIACGELVGTVGFDFFSGSGVNAVSGGETFGDRFGEIQFSRSEEVAKQADVLGGIMESLGDDVGRETVDKGGAEGLITTLPVRDGMDKKGSILHERCYTI